MNGIHMVQIMKRCIYIEEYVFNFYFIPICKILYIIFQRDPTFQQLETFCHCRFYGLPYFGEKLRGEIHINSLLKSNLSIFFLKKFI